MKVLSVVNGAIGSDSDLVFKYVNKGNGSANERHVHPVEILNGNVLVAVDLEKDSYRRIILDNMSEVRSI